LLGRAAWIKKVSLGYFQVRSLPLVLFHPVETGAIIKHPRTMKVQTNEYTPVLLSAWHSYRVPILLSLLASIGVKIWISKQNQTTTEVQDPPTKTLPRETARRAPPEADKKQPLLPPRSNPEQKQTYGAPKRVRGIKPTKNGVVKTGTETTPPSAIQPLVFFASLTGTTEQYAKSVCEGLRAESERLRASGGQETLLEPQLHDLSYIDLDDFFISPPKQNPDALLVYCIIIPTYNIDSVINNFLEHLKETHHGPRRRKASARRQRKSISGWPSLPPEKELSRWAWEM
jgi:hypothetical protein